MSKSFQALGVSAPVVRALAQRNITHPFSVQALALPAPLRRALAAARHHLEPATPAAAALVLAQLVAPARDVLGSEAGEVLAVAARTARVHL